MEKTKKRDGFKHSVAVAYGDGIGPEITQAVLNILHAAEVPLQFEEVVLGERLYLAGHSSGIDDGAWEIIRRNKVLLKGPITTPRGGGYKSLNVTMRKALGLYSNIRPCVSYAPYVATKHPNMDVVVIRENEEDVYAGIEHRQTDEVVQCLKLITRPGCERIIRFAFEYARVYGRKKVSCFVKDNIMKQTDGLFYQVFQEIAAEYPQIESTNFIVDIGIARLADSPSDFDVIVLPNLYGDIVSDVTAQLSGSVGLAGSGNVGDHGALFEAIHGSAPDIAGRDLANPSGLLQAAVQMLQYLQLPTYADRIFQAWAYTLEEGYHTADIFEKDTSVMQVGTQAFAQRVIANLGKRSSKFKLAKAKSGESLQLKPYIRKEPARKLLRGVDLFLDWRGVDPNELAERVAHVHPSLELTMITNRGVKVWPGRFEETFCTDHWRCRLEAKAGEVDRLDVPAAVQQAILAGCEVIKTENLYEFDGVKGYSLGQGQ